MIVIFSGGKCAMGVSESSSDIFITKSILCYYKTDFAIISDTAIDYMI